MSGSLLVGEVIREGLQQINLVLVIAWVQGLYIKYWYQAWGWVPISWHV